MAGALVGGAFLSGFINVVLDRLISAETVNLAVGEKLGPELVERLRNALGAAEVLLLDAERRQFDNQHVKYWLNSLRDAIYEADDLLDHIFTKAATQKEVRTLLSRFFNSRETDMVNKVEQVVRRIEDIEQRKSILGLKEIPSDNNSSWRTSTSLEVEGNIYGREDDKKAIINILNDNNGQELSVIPIVGMGGVGKTTLAKWVYNNEDLMFDLKVWVCVSEQFNVVEITKTIIRGISSDTFTHDDLNLLHVNLKKELSKKKFLIVLDDVWSHDRHEWIKFKIPFQHGNKGSKILVTTRDEKVASIVQTCPPLFLNVLSEEYCWPVFVDNACFLESNGNSKLEEIGRKIVKKCKGLPLAAETLGRLLHREHDVKKWNAILMSEIWGFSMEDSKIIPALLISYYNLPAHLKRCFVYCSLFPKDYKFNKDELVILWMAEDLLRPPKTGETLEEVGFECFGDLASRLFLKPLWEYGCEYFTMHDLLHDLAIFLAGDFYCRLEEPGSAEKMGIQTRHLSDGRLCHPISCNFYSIDKVEYLRTFLSIYFSCPSFNTESTHCVKLLKLKYLRVVSFHSFGELDALPDSIGELIHLRYLDLSQTRIKMLPESLCGLYNLQTLKLSKCRSLTTLPSGMHNLVNLRHLDIWDTDLKEMPREMSKLKHLNFLSYFVVGRQENNGIKELGGLSNLRGTLEIGNLENVSNSDEAMGARLMDKTNIDHLCLGWSSGDDIVSNTQTERDIFDKLQPHDGLKSLRVWRYRGTRLSDWVGLSSYQNMTSISLLNCRSCCMLPSLGQLPSLESLVIGNFDGLETIGAEFYKNEDDHSSPASPFPSLVDLAFRHMPSWEVWSSLNSNAFPQLKRLEIEDCLRFKGALPNHLPALETLKIHRCQQLEALPNHLPALKTLQIWECQQLGALPSQLLALETLEIHGCQQLGALPNHLPALVMLEIDGCQQLGALPNHLPALETLHINGCQQLGALSNHLPALEKLFICRCQQLGALPNHLPALKTLQIWECQQLGALPNHLPALVMLEIYGCQQLGALPNYLPALETLDIHECQQLVSSLPRAPTIRDLWISKSDQIGLQELPLSLQSLSLTGCRPVESMFQAMSIAHPTCLGHITISDFPTATSLPWDCLPESLKSLRIKNCRKLEFPHPQQRKHRLLKIELLKSCDSLTTFPLEAFPNLEDLSIVEGCENLDSLSLSESQHTALHNLTIKDCPNFVSFPKEGLAAPNMTSFKVINCCKLKSLPCHMNTLLPNLGNLEILDCPEIDSFPEGGLPSNLKSLYVWKCEKLLSNLSSMGMHEALTDLTLIDGSDCLLPSLPSLTSLLLRGFSNMETFECKELLRLTSLQELVIQDCLKLGNIAGERLPGSLLRLYIDNCPLLAERCKNKHPQIWPKICHIDGIHVDGRWVSRPRFRNRRITDSRNNDQGLL